MSNNVEVFSRVEYFACNTFKEERNRIFTNRVMLLPVCEHHRVKNHTAESQCNKLTITNLTSHKCSMLQTVNEPEFLEPHKQNTSSNLNRKSSGKSENCKTRTNFQRMMKCVHTVSTISTDKSVIIMHVCVSKRMFQKRYESL